MFEQKQEEKMCSKVLLAIKLGFNSNDEFAQALQNDGGVKQGTLGKLHL
jgi:hypothetical protein